jgi:hypothetical protein
MVLRGPRDREAPPAFLAAMELLVQPDRRAWLVPKACRASRVKLVPLDRLGPRALQAQKGPRGRPGQRVRKEKREPLAALAWQAPMEKSVKREPRVPRAKSGLPVPWVLRGCRESRAKSAPQGKQEPPDPKEKPARTGLQVLRVR